MSFLVHWAHRLLLWVGILVVIGVFIYAGFQGWLEGIVPGTQERLAKIAEPLWRLLPALEGLERFSRIMGALATAFTAAAGVVTGIYYAKGSLPQRLRELMAAEDERLLRDRAPLLAAISQSRPYTHETTVFYVRPLERALKEIGFGNLEPANASLEDAVKELEEKIATSKAETVSMEKQKVAAHILRGSIASARAEANANLRDECRRLAEQEFSSALAIRPDDLDALELRGRQRQLRGNEPGAFADFQELSTVAAALAVAFPTEATRMLVRAARACRWQAGLSEQLGNQREARTRLNRGLVTINAIGSLNQEAWFEKACLHAAYARVQINLNQLPVARKHLQQAINSFAQVPTEDAHKLGKDAQDALDELTPPSASPPQGLWARLVAWIRSWFD